LVQLCYGITVLSTGYAGMNSKTIDDLRLFGSGIITQVQVNGVNTAFSQDPVTRELTLSNMGLSPTSPFTISFQWSYYTQM